MMKKNSILGRIKDQDFLLHKLLTYETTVVLVVVCFIVSANSKESKPSYGTIRVIKDFKQNWPVTETKDSFFVNANGRNCDVAIQRGYEEL